ncbi:MAG: amidohydrolase family protein [Acidimicrobiales bacterium]
MAELVIRGGMAVTVGALGTAVMDLAIDGGRITAIGSDVGRGDEEVDARGCLVMPGLVQAHVHLCQTLFRGLADDLDVMDWLREWIWPLESAHDSASMAASCRLGLAELLRSGTTTVVSMETLRHADRSFEAASDLGARAFIGKALMDRTEPGTEMEGEETGAAIADLERLIGRWDGAAGGRLRVAVSPRGPRNATPELWRAAVDLAEANDLVLHTHVNENRAQADRLGRSSEGRDVVALDGWGALGPRMIMAHCVWLDERERRLLRGRRAHVCHCPSANLKLASGIAPIPEYLAAGVNVALGADGAACNNHLDAFAEMRQAALVHKPRCGPRAMPARTVLELATMGGARAVSLADEIGSLEVGKQADIVVVRRDGPGAGPAAGGDPADALVYAHTGRDVDTVTVGGRVVVRDGVLLSGDGEAIRREAEVQRRALLERAGRWPA